jgi:quercetin dioxygenase-like cupin family protein
MRRRQLLIGSAAVIAAQAGLQASAQLVNKYAEQLQNGEFNWFPERSPQGPVLIIVSLPDQRVHVYRNGIRIAASTCSTGKPGHRTPTGVFKILQKDKHHRSSTYNNAPMPNMNRLTWSGIALHAGNLPGYPASHGCVRLPMGFSERLFGVTRLGMTVVIADQRSFPESVVHPGLVLGNYARQEYAAVDTTLKKGQYSAGHAPAAKQTSVVVNGSSKRITVMEDEKIVAAGSVEIEEGARPLPDSVHTLVAADPEKGDLRWSSVGYGKGDREDLSRELRRIRAEPKVRTELSKRMHHGMTVVTTHAAATPKHQAGSDFVVIDGIY